MSDVPLTTARLLAIEGQAFGPAALAKFEAVSAVFTFPIISADFRAIRFDILLKVFAALVDAFLARVNRVRTGRVGVHGAPVVLRVLSDRLSEARLFALRFRHTGSHAAANAASGLRDPLVNFFTGDRRDRLSGPKPTRFRESRSREGFAGLSIAPLSRTGSVRYFRYRVPSAVARRHFLFLFVLFLCERKKKCPPPSRPDVRFDSFYRSRERGLQAI